MNGGNNMAEKLTDEQFEGLRGRIPPEYEHMAQLYAYRCMLAELQETYGAAPKDEDDKP